MLRRFRTSFLFALLSGLVFLTAFLSYSVSERFIENRTVLESDASLRLASEGLLGALRRFEPIPAILADRADVRSLLSQTPNQQQVDNLNLDLKSVAEEVGASDIYVMNADGLTVAASNFEAENTFIGKNYLFRPYFSEAIEGHPSRYFALGTSSLKRGFYFSAPVWADGLPIGVMAVKFEVDDFERAWEGFNHDLIVTDPDGIIFMSSKSEWLFSSLNRLVPALVERLRQSRKYPVSELNDLDAIFSPSDETGLLEFSQAAGGNKYFVRSSYMPEAGWTLRILTDTSIVTRQAWQATSIAVMVVLLISMTTGLIVISRNRQLRRIEEQKEAKLLLETRVEERTVELKREVGERIQAEEELRRAQNELVQAGKLAALGQMSAALSHELNQPLAAVKTYADNAATFLDRDRVDDAKANLTRISDMTDRMAQISNSLRNFARKPREQIGVVNLSDVMKEVVPLMSGRLRETNAQLKIDPIPDDLTVLGGHVRLQQVIVNLINNAIDAMIGQEAPIVEIQLADMDEKIELSVRDYGPGISDELFENIFDPFFTTKGINEGLGLGLSISFNILRDFGGHLSASNHSDIGAVFTAALVKSETSQEAAE